MEQKPENFTKTIYQLATELKEEALRKFLQEQGKDVGAVSGRDSAIYLLAQDGEIEAVYFLIENFNASRNWALMGAAAGGYERLDLINRLLAEGATINYAMYSAGLMRDERLIRYLEAKGASWGWAVNYTDSLKCIARLRGAALLVGASIEDLPQRVGTPIIDLMNLCKMSLAAAQNGNEHFVDQLLAISEHTLVDPSFLNPYRYATRGAFLGAQETLCKRFSTRFGHQYHRDKYYSELYENAARGAGEGGHLNLINRILGLLNPDRTEEVLYHALVGAAEGDQLNLISILLSMGGKLSDDFFRAAANAGNLTILNEYLDKFESREKKVYSDIIDSLNSSHISSNKDEVLRSASFLNNSRLRKLFIKAAKNNLEYRKEYKKAENKIYDEIDVDSLYRKASILNGLMREHKINYNQAQAWTSPVIHEWLLQSKPGPLPDEIIFKIAHHATTLTQAEAVDLGLKINAYYQQRKEARLLKKESSPLKDQSIIAEEGESKENTPDINKPAP